MKIFGRTIFLLDVLWVLPVLEIFDIVYKTGIFHVSSLSQEVKIVRVPKTLHKLHLYLE